MKIMTNVCVLKTNHQGNFMNDEKYMASPQVHKQHPKSEKRKEEESYYLLL